MLFPASSIWTSLLFFCRASTRLLPPSRPIWFHLKSVDRDCESVWEHLFIRMNPKQNSYHSNKVQKDTIYSKAAVWSFVVAGSILSYAFCLFKLNLGFFFWIFITLLSVAFNKCEWGSGVMFYSSYPFFFHSYTLFLNRLHSLCLNQCHMRFICQSPSFSRVQLCLRARASSVAPLWLIWLFRRSSCVSTLLEARPSQKSEKASSLIPNAFHSNTSLWTHDSTVYVYCNSKRH